MSVPANEFARPVRIDTIGEDIREIAIESDAAERAALAKRFDLVAIDRLTSALRIRRAGEIIHAEGTVEARVVQACVASGAPLAARVAAPFVLRFVPEPLVADQEEMELSDDDCDTVGYAGGAVDLGEAAAETLYLALDPFPRAPDADEALKAAGVVGEEDAGPFAALKALREKMAGEGR